MDISMMARLKELEGKNARLKRMYAENEQIADWLLTLTDNHCN
jgi:hypothetical protein